MQAFLRNIVLLKVIGDGADYEYRVAGDAHIAAIGALFQGLLLSHIEAVAPEYGRMSRMTYAGICTSAEPYCVRGWMAAIFRMPVLPNTRAFFCRWALPTQRSITCSSSAVMFRAFRRRLPPAPRRLHFRSTINSSPSARHSAS